MYPTINSLPEEEGGRIHDFQSISEQVIYVIQLKYFIQFL